MNTDREEPLFKSESQEIVGAAMELLNEIGHGFHEKPYENALKKVGEYVPDLIAYDLIVVDTKVIEKIPTVKSGR